MNTTRILHRPTFALLFFTFLALTPSLTPAEVITYDYDNAGQVKKAIYADRAQIEYVYDNAGNMTTRAVTVLYPDISANPLSLGFGNIHVSSTSAPQTITITNSGTASLNISTIAKTGSDAGQFSIQTDTCSNTTIAPSGTCQLSITFTPTSGGSKNATIAIPSNDPDTPTLNIPINGNGAFLVTIAKNGTAAGTVTGPGIDCGADCTEVYASGSQITLTGSTTGQTCSTFAGWAGGGCAGTGNCTPTITADTTITATFNMPPPVASFTPAPNAGKLPLTVNFTDSSTCATAWSWNFGDGTTSTLRNPQQTYNQPIAAGQFKNLYTVTLTASNASGSNPMPYSYIQVLCPNDPARNTRTGQQYTSLQAAYNAALSGDTIQTQAVTFLESPVFNQAKTITIDGGYNCYYSVKTGNTIIIGNVTDSNGLVIMGSIVISQ